MGYSPWGRKESDTTEQLTTTKFLVDHERFIFMEDLQQIKRKLQKIRRNERIRGKKTTHHFATFAESRFK